VVAEQGPAKRQRIGNHLAKCTDPDAHDIDVLSIGIWAHYVGDCLTKRHLMHEPSQLGCAQR
jgi:hypothetical protein